MALQAPPTSKTVMGLISKTTEAMEVAGQVVASAAGQVVAGAAQGVHTALDSAARAVENAAEVLNCRTSGGDQPVPGMSFLISHQTERDAAFTGPAGRLISSSSSPDATGEPVEDERLSYSQRKFRTSESADIPGLRAS
jgi:hypothetical protein